MIPPSTTLPPVTSLVPTTTSAKPTDWWASADFWTIVGGVVAVLTLAYSILRWGVRMVRRRRARQVGLRRRWLRRGGPAVNNDWPPLSSRFTGRADLLGQLRQALSKGRPVVLHGLGGVGKTQTALAYLRRRQHAYRVIWWVRAEEIATLTRDLARLAGPLGLPERADPDQTVVVGAVRRWLAANDRWLLVLDNATTEHAIAHVLPAQPLRGQVLLTSRNPMWRDAIQIHVRSWTSEESVAFLCTSLPQAQRTDQEGMAALADELGHLPIALDQACAYMHAVPRSIAEYLALLHEEPGHWLDVGGLPDDERTVAKTWAVALEKLHQTKGAKELLNLCAFLAPDDIPLELVTEGAAVLPEPLREVAGDRRRLDQAVIALRRYSFVTLADYTLDVPRQGALTVHRLVQAVTRAGMDEQATRDWAGAAVRLAAGRFPRRSDDVDNWSGCQRLLAHALTAAKRSVDAGVETERAVTLYNDVARYLWARAEREEAKELLQRTYTVIADRLGEENLCAATNLSVQGKVLRELGDLEGAKHAHERALAIRKRCLGSDQLELAWSLGNLGKVLRELGQLDKSKQTHQEALRILEDKLHPEHRDVAWGLGNLGRTLTDLGALDEAKHAHERALAIRERCFGSDHPDVAWSLRHLGDTLHVLAQKSTMGDHFLRETRDHYQRALTIFEHRFGADHPEVWAMRRRLQFLPKGFGTPLDQPDTGFQLLFDGANLRPWWRMAGPGYFIVLEGGILQTEGGMGLLWYAAHQFRDFILRLDWMATSPEDNSGVFMRFPDPGNDPEVAVNRGYEVQIDDRQKSKHEDSKVQTGAIYGFKAPGLAAAKPVGEWNSYEIKVVGQTYTVILNGHKVVDNWTGTGGRGTRGYIGLQNHHEGSRVRFRNLRIKEMDRTAGNPSSTNYR